VLAVSPTTGAVAVGCNMGQESVIALWDAELQRKATQWKTLHQIEDLAWSPEGDRVAAVWWMPPYPDDGNGRRSAISAHSRRVEPSLSIYDTFGHVQSEISTGRFEAKVVFRPDAKVIYTVSHAKCCVVGYGGTDWAKDDLRMYDIQTGALLRNFKVPGSGVRNNFALSPSGNLIAAESTVDVKTSFLSEHNSLNVDAGFVILDSLTGQIMFRERRKTEGAVVNQVVPLLFSPDGSKLFAGFNSVAGEYRSRTETVEYSTR